MLRADTIKTRTLKIKYVITTNLTDAVQIKSAVCDKSKNLSRSNKHMCA